MGTLDAGLGQPWSAMLDYAEAGRALPGQDVSGDACLVRRHEGGVLLAVCDGLGHGPDAAEASGLAIATLNEAEADTPLATLFEHCHRAMPRTRGAVLSLAFLDATARTLSWSGIGNVDGVLLRADGTAAALLCRGGVVGYRMPAPRIDVLPLAAGDLIILATDGIGSRFPAQVDRSASCEVIAQTVLAHWAKESDDALVLAARWLGA